MAGIVGHRLVVRPRDGGGLEYVKWAGCPPRLRERGEMIRKIVGKDHPKVGLPPAVVLYNPKYPRNVGAVVRAASCYGVGQVWFTGNRFKIEEGERLPREERMRGYQDVELYQFDRPLDMFEGCTPVAIEVRPGSEPLVGFEHPQDAVYVFGPEDGSLPDVMLRLCHRFVSIPTRHCLNLSMAVGTVLYDRQAKLFPERRLDDLIVGEEREIFRDDPVFQMQEG
jgi:tRNA(Leu) C34 or U34 (ribose-2'-O)-methylase TrmL